MHGLTSDTRTGADRLMLSLCEEEYSFLTMHLVTKCQKTKKKQTKKPQKNPQEQTSRNVPGRTEEYNVLIILDF